MKKFKTLIIIAVLIFSDFFVTMIAMHTITYFENQKFAATISQEFDEKYRKEATITLSEVRGRLIELKSLFKTDVPLYIIQDEMYEIIELPSNYNPYLNKFQFTIMGTYSTEKICDDLISQIDNQINIIWFSD